MTIAAVEPTNGYIQAPVTVDPSALIAAALAAIAAALPGWIPVNGTIEEIVLEQSALMNAESASVAAQMPLLAFQFLGQLYGISPEAGAAASALTTWTMINNAGYTVPAGTVVAYNELGNVQIQFETVNDFTVAPGNTTAAGIEIVAQVIGAVNNGIPDTTPIVPIQQLSFVSSIVATTVTSGGIDAEDITTYLDRLSNLLQLSSPRPILPGDFAVLAQSAVDNSGASLGVYRAVAINGLNPGRVVPNVVIASGSPNINDPAAGFTLADIGRSVTGSIDIPGSTTISNVLVAGRTLSAAGFSTSSKNLNCSTASFTANDIGRTVTGTGLASGTTIASISSGTVAVMNNFPTITEASESVVLGALASCQTAVMSNNASGSTTESITLGDLTNQERCVTVAAVDIDGNALTTPVEAELSAFLQAKREANFLVPVIAPTYTEVDVTWTGLALPGADVTTVQAAGDAALATFLSPANWGGGNDDPPQWDAAATIVYRNALIGLLATVPGMQLVSTVTLAIHGNALGTSDITLLGDAPLPTAGTISGSVSAGA